VALTDPWWHLSAMDDPFGMQVRFTTRPGKGDEFVSILQGAALDLEDFEACLLYLVSQEADTPDVVWVTEVWVDNASHAASLEHPHVRSVIDRALPLLAGAPEALHLRPAGGKGIRLP
jgi:quinol monooxygenase YgiN